MAGSTRPGHSGPTVIFRFGASSPIRRVVSYRLQSAESGPSRSNRRTERSAPQGHLERMTRSLDSRHSVA
jgi:hypothetical protein